MFHPLAVGYHQQTARLQDAPPFPKGFFRVRQGPQRISGDYGVKGVVPKCKVFRVAGSKIDIEPLGLGIFFGTGDHILGDINARHFKSAAGEIHGELAGAGSDVQYPFSGSFGNDFIYNGFPSPRNVFRLVRVMAETSTSPVSNSS